jgi:hypothetical protein
MDYLRGTVIFYDAVEHNSSEMYSMLAAAEAWAKEHGNGKVAFFTGRPHYSRNSYAFGAVKITDCLLRPETVGRFGMLDIGEYKAYLGTFEVIRLFDDDVDAKAAKPSFNFPQELLYFFEQMQFTEEERNKVLNMTIREFLDTCKWEEWYNG